MPRPHLEINLTLKYVHKSNPVYNIIWSIVLQISQLDSTKLRCKIEILYWLQAGRGQNSAVFVSALSGTTPVLAQRCTGQRWFWHCDVHNCVSRVRHYQQAVISAQFRTHAAMNFNLALSRAAMTPLTVELRPPWICKTKHTVTHEFWVRFSHFSPHNFILIGK